MIREHELYHGAALLKLLSTGEQSVEVRAFAASGVKSSYILNGSVGVYIKHSALRMSPWTFTFQPAHQEELARMATSFQNIFLLLVCERDGIAILAGSEIGTVLDLDSRATQWVSAKRGKREQYRVKGSNGSLAFKVADSDFQKIHVALEMAKQGQASIASM
jgi:hypothetical protein